MRYKTRKAPAARLGREFEGSSHMPPLRVGQGPTIGKRRKEGGEKHGVEKLKTHQKLVKKRIKNQRKREEKKCRRIHEKNTGIAQ